MKAYIHLLEYIIDLWDPKQQHFVVGTHILTIDIEDIYFLTRLSQRGRKVVLSIPWGGEFALDDMIDSYWSTICFIGSFPDWACIPSAQYLSIISSKEISPPPGLDRTTCLPLWDSLVKKYISLMAMVKVWVLNTKRCCSRSHMSMIYSKRHR